MFPYDIDVPEFEFVKVYQSHLPGRLHFQPAETTANTVSAELQVHVNKAHDVAKTIRPTLMAMSGAS